MTFQNGTIRQLWLYKYCTTHALSSLKMDLRQLWKVRLDHYRIWNLNNVAVAGWWGWWCWQQNIIKIFETSFFLSFFWGLKYIFRLGFVELVFFFMKGERGEVRSRQIRKQLHWPSRSRPVQRKKKSSLKVEFQQELSFVLLMAWTKAQFCWQVYQKQIAKLYGSLLTTF